MTKTLKNIVCAFALAAVALAAAAHGYTAGALKIGHPWSRATVPGQPGGGFMKIENTGTAPDRLLGASTPVAERVELHTMAMDGNVMRMREVTAIEVPAGQAVLLKPGALHLMLMGLKAPLKADTQVPLTLKFEKAGEVKVELKVEAADFGGAASHAH